MLPWGNGWMDGLHDLMCALHWAGADPSPRPGGLHITPNIILTANKPSAGDAEPPTPTSPSSITSAFTQPKVSLTTPGTTSFSRGSTHTRMSVKQEEISDYFSDWDPPASGPCPPVPGLALRSAPCPRRSCQRCQEPWHGRVPAACPWAGKGAPVTGMMSPGSPCPLSD